MNYQGILDFGFGSQTFLPWAKTGLDSQGSREHNSAMQAAWKSRLCAAVVAGTLCPGGFGQSALAESITSILPPSAGRPVDFARDVQPILTNNCYECHGPLKQKGGLRLDEKAAALRGRDSGPLLIPGQSSNSLLILAVV